ncbi:MAG: TIGR01906 family membrane protein [Candidatus Nanoarchaeia archaeon]|nr:TIGR01906 family membrane protein [Candidatus Nanoarchaeia archaeon]
MKLKIDFIIFAVLFIFLLGFKFEVFNENFYDKQFDKNGVYDSFGKEKVIEENNNLINYLQGKGELDTKFFNEKEKLHLKDVKDLIVAANVLFYLCLIFIVFYIIYFIKKKEFRLLKNSLWFSVLTVFFILFLFLIFDFSSLFIKFHELFFSNNLWILDPLKDNLIVMFPETFFYSIFTEMIMDIILICLFLVLVNSKLLNNVNHG